MKAPFDFSIILEKPDRMTHVLRTAMSLPLDIQAVFAFFCDPSNLERITPPELHFHITTPKPIQMAEGVGIDYRLRLFHFPFNWRTKISLWDPPRRFVDEQVQSPYRLWVHTHRFDEDGGMTAIRDEVLYRLPLWPAGEMTQRSRPCIPKTMKRLTHQNLGPYSARHF